MSFMPRNLVGTPASSVPDIGSDAIARDYDRSHPDDTFDDLCRRAEFDKHDLGLLRQWLALAALRSSEPDTRTAPLGRRSVSKVFEAPLRGGRGVR